MHCVTAWRHTHQRSRSSDTSYHRGILQGRSLLKNLDIDVKLSDLGIEEKDIPWMAENCMKVSAASIANNPVVFTQEEIAEIYKKAM